MTTIVLAHPWDGSFNKAILDTLTRKFTTEKREFNIIDLNKDNFNPVCTEHDLMGYSKGLSTDPLVAKYQEIIGKTDELIFIFPIWWSTMPAILKGFFDKVFLLNFAFTYKGGWTPLLSIGKSAVITTSENTTEVFRNSIENIMIGQMLKDIGVSNTRWFNCQHVSSSSQVDREEFLESLSREL